MGKLLRKFRKNKDVTKHKLNKVKSTTLKLALIMLNFIFATFAWFTYVKVLNPEIDVHVSAWQVDFKDNNVNIIGNNMNFQVGNFYPGMQDYAKEIEIVNLGDRVASIEYQIDELKILGAPYTIKETPEAGDLPNTVYKSETIDVATGMKVIKLLNDSSKYPFEIVLTHSQEINIPNAGNPDGNKGSFEIRFTWPYELSAEATQEEILQKNDLDTQWGYDIANFYDNLPAGNTTQGIEMSLTAIAKQVI